MSRLHSVGSMAITCGEITSTIQCNINLLKHWWTCPLCSRCRLTYRYQGCWTVLQQMPCTRLQLPSTHWKQPLPLNCSQGEAWAGAGAWPQATTSPLQGTCMPSHRPDVLPAVLTGTFSSRVNLPGFKPLCGASYLPDWICCATSYWWADAANKFHPHLLAFWQSTIGHSVQFHFLN